MAATYAQGANTNPVVQKLLEQKEEHEVQICCHATVTICSMPTASQCEGMMLSVREHALLSSDFRPDCCLFTNCDVCQQDECVA